ncbi:leucine-rich repeat domain-containing protein [Treponema primitia]|uniref:leucine-rich repeat domain-containing protein n=1 Tax=Treponema primitia TaxID=88058 RepID=UPI00025557FD|nr:leucine-rich repeat domain-containing protein [Treponema primitia]
MDDEYDEEENTYKTILTIKEGDTSDYSRRQGKEIVALKFAPGISAIRANFSHNEIRSLTIPDTVTAISRGAFANNLLTELILSHKLSVIGRNTFAENFLTALTIPEGVEGIDIDGFRKNRLNKVSLPSTLKWLGDGAFSENPLVSITLGSLVEGRDADGTPNSIPAEETFGIYGRSFISCYIETGSAAGTYRYNESTGVWSYGH